MKKEIKNVKILEKTVRLDKAQMLKQVQHDMEVVQDDMEVYGHCERMRSNPAYHFARSADKVLSLFTSHFSQKFGFTLAEGATHVALQHNKRKFAFTLAEVLITLGIIGVVAAMTMPSLIQKHQEKVTVAKLKKVYSVLSQAFLQACNEYGTPDSWELAKNGEPAVNAAPKIKQFLKVADDCGVNDCENYSIRGGHFRVLRGGIYGSGYYSNDYKLKLTDGTELSFRENSPVFMALVDINGQQGPNTMGKDIFHFAFRSDGTMVPGGIGADPKNMGFSACNPKMEGWNCTAWVIYNENMDYLRCADELSWDGKHKCSD